MTRRIAVAALATMMSLVLAVLLGLPADIDFFRAKNSDPASTASLVDHAGSPSFRSRDGLRQLGQADRKIGSPVRFDPVSPSGAIPSAMRRDSATAIGFANRCDLYGRDPASAYDCRGPPLPKT
jgi:hypothetical protein